MDQQQVAQATKSYRFLLMGFIAILLLLLIVAANSLVYFSKLSHDLKNIVSVNIVKTTLLQKMKDAMRIRQLNLRDMMLSDDPFEQDEAWQQHADAANTFMLARDELVALGLSDEEAVIYNKLLAHAREGAYAQERVVSMIQQGTDIPNVNKIFRQARQIQQDAFEQMTILAQMQHNSANLALADARKNYQIIFFTTLVLGIVALLTGIAIVTYVMRRNKLQMALIHNYQHHLEERVQNRTKELTHLNKELQSFNYTLAHDLRTPLRAVVSFGQIVCEETGSQLDEDAREKLQRIVAAGKKMAHILDDLGMLTRICNRELKFENVDLTRLASNIMEILRKDAPDRPAEISVQPNLTANTDKSLIKLVLQHLLLNAWHYTRDRQKTVIRIGKNSEHGIDTFFISDNGIGFEMEYAKIMFGEFQQLEQSKDIASTGIGLAIVERAIRRQDGKVWATSAPGEGATFYFTLGNDHDAEDEPGKISRSDK